MCAPKVSVIVPIYNAHALLVKRLDTLIKQTLREIEIILVLDCPTDGSDKIAKQYASKDSRIVIIENPQNLHIGQSRNEGLLKASGEYICFSDHDDYSELDMLEKMYQKAKEVDADVVLSGFYRENDGKTVYFGFPNNCSDQYFQQQSLSFLINCRYDKNHVSFASNGLIWNQIYRREFLTQNNITFKDTKKVTFEDRLFLIEVYYHARKFAILPDAFYYHTSNPNLNSAGSNYAYRKIDFVINYLEIMYEFLQRNNIYEQEAFHYSTGALLNLYSAFRNELRHQSRKMAFRELSKIRKNEMLQQAFRHLLLTQKLGVLQTFRVTKVCFLLLVLRLGSFKEKK